MSEQMFHFSGERLHGSFTARPAILETPKPNKHSTQTINPTLGSATIRSPKPYSNYSGRQEYLLNGPPPAFDGSTDSKNLAALVKKRKAQHMS